MSEVPLPNPHQKQTEFNPDLDGLPDSVMEPPFGKENPHSDPAQPIEAGVFEGNAPGTAPPDQAVAHDVEPVPMEEVMEPPFGKENPHREPAHPIEAHEDEETADETSRPVIPSPLGGAVERPFDSDASESEAPSPEQSPEEPTADEKAPRQTSQEVDRVLLPARTLEESDDREPSNLDTTAAVTDVSATDEESAADNWVPFFLGRKRNRVQKNIDRIEEQAREARIKNVGIASTQLTRRSRKRSLRNNLRHDAILKRGGDIHDLMRGPYRKVMANKAAFKAVQNSDQFSGRLKRNLRKTDKRVYTKQASILRIHDRIGPAGEPVPVAMAGPFPPKTRLEELKAERDRLDQKIADKQRKRQARRQQSRTQPEPNNHSQTDADITQEIPVTEATLNQTRGVRPDSLGLDWEAMRAKATDTNPEAETDDEPEDPTRGERAAKRDAKVVNAADRAGDTSDETAETQPQETSRPLTQSGPATSMTREQLIEHFDAVLAAPDSDAQKEWARIKAEIISQGKPEFSPEYEQAVSQARDAHIRATIAKAQEMADALLAERAARDAVDAARQNPDK